MTARDSVSEWIVGAQQGECRAVEQLWHRYFERLVRLARRKLAGLPRRADDEEDVALSAFASFCRAAEQGRFPNLSDRDSLWRLLVTITAQKATDRARHHRRKKRGAGRVRGESALVDPDASGDRQGLAQVIGDSPTPEFAALVAEECRALLDQLDDDLRPVALAKMEEHTNQEIAGKLGCSLSTVERRLRLIRKTWLQDKKR